MFQRENAGDCDRSKTFSQQNQTHVLLDRLLKHQSFHIQKTFKWWRGIDSNYRRQSRQIYSLFHLATLEPLQKFVVYAVIQPELCKTVICTLKFDYILFLKLQVIFQESYRFLIHNDLQFQQFPCGILFLQLYYLQIPWHCQVFH